MAKYEVKDINKNGKIDSWEQAKYDAINKSAESPATMISTAIAGTNPMTGMIQPNQIAPTAINPNALGSMQAQIPGIVGQSIPGSYDKVMPNQTGLAAPLQRGHDPRKVKTDTIYMPRKNSVTGKTYKIGDLPSEDDFEAQFKQIKGNSKTFPQLSVQDYSKIKYNNPPVGPQGDRPYVVKLSD